MHQENAKAADAIYIQSKLVGVYTKGHHKYNCVGRVSEGMELCSYMSDLLICG